MQRPTASRRLLIAISPRKMPLGGGLIASARCEKATLVPPELIRRRGDAPRNQGLPEETLSCCRTATSVKLGRQGQGRRMYAIVYRSDGFPVCRQVPGVSPDPVVTWNTEAAAKAFISSKGGEADFQPLRLTDDAMDRLAR